MDRFDLVQDRGRSWNFVDVVMKIRFLTRKGNSLLYEELLACQEEMYFMGRLVS
jgi:hypothetical protein